MGEIRRYFALTLALLTVAVISPRAQTQPPKEASHAAPQSVQQIQPSNVPLQQAVTAGRDPELERRIAILEAQISSLNNLILIAGSILLLFLALGTAGSIYSLWNSEGRAREAHTLAIAGESAAQNRAAEVHTSFLEESKTTLHLVNETLRLARDASERAAHFLEEKAREARDSLDIEAKDLLANVPQGDERTLVADPKKRSSLTSLAQKLSAFEINRFILPRDVKLTAPCMFVRGMEYHLRQQFEDAFRCWKLVALDEGAEDALRGSAWYWTGMEHNNLGDFSEAVRNFDRALKYSKGSQVYELKRISIESRLFDNAESEPENLIEPLELLIKEVSAQPQSEEVHSRRRKIFVTMGNVHHVVGEKYRRAGNEKEATGHFQSAEGYFEKASDKDKWARFGLAEALFQSGKVEAARKIFKTRVLPDAQRESIDRMEPRSKVVGRMTELLCCVRLPELSDRFAQIYGQVLDSLGDVDGRLTVYSQIQRRNVLRNDFVSDLVLLRDEVRKDKTEVRDEEPTVTPVAAVEQLVPDALNRRSA